MRVFCVLHPMCRLLLCATIWLASEQLVAMLFQRCGAGGLSLLSSGHGRVYICMCWCAPSTLQGGMGRQAVAA